MPLSDPELWTAIRTWPLPGREVRRWRSKPTKHVTFAESLAWSHGLYRESAAGVEAEYRRWLYLCAVHGRRLQGSDWMANAEKQHRKDAGNWHRLQNGPLAVVKMGDLVMRNRANDPNYAETLSLYSRDFPEGMVFGKVWPGVRKHKSMLAARFLSGMTLGGLALFLASHWGIVSVTWLETLGIMLFLSGLAGGGVLSYLSPSPWQDDDNGYY